MFKMIFSQKSWKWLLLVALTLPNLFAWSPLRAQDARVVQGVVLDEKKLPVPGTTVSVKQTDISTSTTHEGRFSIRVPAGKQVLVFTYVGKIAQEVNVGNQPNVSVILKDSVIGLEDVIVVGYGRQKRESVVAAVSQTTGAVLERAGGVSNIGAALTGNVPGLITAQSTGLPGEEDPQIIIRGRSTWNSSSPLVLVDGVERPMTSVDIGSVESITVLKDASATAVFGSRGANGVILITTKRGKTGKASIRATVNTVVKSPSKLPGKADSYESLRTINDAIEYEVALKPESWNQHTPLDIINKYRNPANLEEAERYPNVDWAKTLFKDYAMSQNANLNISGGTRFVKYFTSADFLYEGDLFKVPDNNRGYEPGFGFTRANVRTNLDFNLSPSTLFKVNLSGSYGVRKSPWGFTGNQYGPWIDAYTTAPDVFLPKYSDGSWGYFAPNEGRAENSARSVAVGGIQYQTTTRITTDFALEQNLDMLVKGLRFNGTVSMDNTFIESDRGVNDLFNGVQRKWIDPETGFVSYKETKDPPTGFDFQEGAKWSPAAGSVTGNQRRLFYQLQLNYAKTIARKHAVTAMGLLNRNVTSNGSEIPSYREDWVFRTTYTYDGKYTIEYNGAYNGSEKFAPEYRFAFFSSGGLNWIVTRENFMKRIGFLDLLKLRASYGQTGFDNVGGRFLYLTEWAYGGRSRLGMTGEGAEQSPFNWYRETAVGNPNVQWEQSEKYNIGADVEMFKGLIRAKADFFQDNRSKILMGTRTSVPSYYGANPPVANLGSARSRGYELELHVNYLATRNLRLWADLNMTHTQNKVINGDNPELLPDYQKSDNMQIGQTYSYVSQGTYNTWDELYGSTIHNANDNQKLPGNYHIVDYNGDGIIDTRDNIPYGHSNWPENTYNATLGLDWKGLTFFVQFYAVNNVTRQVVFNSLGSQNHVVYDEGSYWSKDNFNADVPMPRWLSTPAGYYRGTQYMFDGSYVRLKNAELAYTFGNGLVKRIGLASLRIYLNGNNLAAWSKMPDDRESNFAGTGWASQGAYPTVKRYNLGANITF
ncbi:SusC/RagA family TonB-linked outer membrane protein [Paraflavitalea sp. CAU 1676]|uniref:SusC/RagA family TonB-linked outer membrane protein n=1 Tax=Paraflavitalea sp. CAU 1676 TaxID=3032598 RepID=UPI0023D9B199|nr:SusC/RagA family TonB-linked outer membrane protein [Paraflavitalea sp. CAU 1676]MDF2191623.1 SusC/RagA family TonB-linked outer membrane protein [Paraflavitalea sp. CAU 1676]